MKTPTCKTCSQQLIQVGKFWVCPEHGQQEIEEVLSTSSLFPETEDHPLLTLADNLPCPLALVLREYALEPNPFVKLHRLTDAAEMLTRFLSMILLSDILRQSGGFPESLRIALSEKIERPTFGAWKDLLELAHRNLPKSKKQVRCFVPELPAYVRDYLLPHLGHGGGDEEKHIIAMRNLLAHAGRLPDTRAEELLTSHQDRFETLMTESAFLKNCALTACTGDGKPVSLQGVPRSQDDLLPVQVPDSMPFQPGRIYLLREHEALDLFPLHAFSEVFQNREGRWERIAGETPQLYFRSDRNIVDFTVLSDKAAFSQQSGEVLERFREIFKLEEWRSLTEADEERKGLAFRPLIEELLEVFVGRDVDVKVVKEKVKSHDRGLFWIAGDPGVGKSALMAKLMKDYEGAAKNMLMIPYFFPCGSCELLGQPVSPGCAAPLADRLAGTD